MIMGHCAKKKTHASALQTYPLALGRGDQDWVVGKSLASRHWIGFRIGFISMVESLVFSQQVIPQSSGYPQQCYSPIVGVLPA
jgi:hypothetical protein